MNKIITTITTLGVVTLGGVAIANINNATEETQPINDIIVQEQIIEPEKEIIEEVGEIKTEEIKEEIEMPVTETQEQVVEETKTCLLIEQFGTTDKWEIFKREVPRASEFFESIGLTDLGEIVKKNSYRDMWALMQAQKYYVWLSNLSEGC